jgi:hypothetical protein
MRGGGIDFGRRPRALPAWVAPLAAALALAGAACAGQAYLAYRADLRHWEALLGEQDLQQGQPGAPDPVRQQLAQQRRQLDQVQLALASPWDSLFATLEAVPHDGVALQELSTDSLTRGVLISAEARDLPTMHAYMRELGYAPGLGAVHLSTHQLVDRDGQNSVHFSVLANWRALGAVPPAIRTAP